MKSTITPTLLACFGLGLMSAHGALVAHYRFDETSGTTAADELGNSDATIEGTVGFVAGVDGGAFSFNGSTANNVTVANAPFLSGSGLGGDFTISVWISFTDVSTNVGTIITLVDQSTTTANAYADLSRIGNGAFGGGIDGSFLGRTRIGNVNITQSNGGGSFNDGDFHHVAFVVSTANSLQQIYVDGNPVSSVAGTPFLTAFTDLTIGHLDRPAGAGQSDVDAFNGILDDLQIYDTALDSGQVGFLANNPGVAVPEPGSLALAGLGLLMTLRRRR